jgi:hypothetical protein
VSFCGPLRRQDPRDTQRDLTVFHLLPQTVELGLLTGIFRYPNRMEGDAALAGLREPAKRRDAATVPHRRQREPVEQRGVDKPIHAVRKGRTNPLRVILTARQHHIGAEFRDECFVAWCRVGDYAQTVCFRQLDDVAADSAGRSADCDGLVWREAEQVEPAGTLATDSAGTTIRSA